MMVFLLKKLHIFRIVVNGYIIKISRDLACVFPCLFVCLLLSIHLRLYVTSNQIECTLGISCMREMILLFSA